MFRNARFYRLDGAWPKAEESLSRNLEKAGFEPCGPLTERSSGWVPVDLEAGDSLARRVNGADLLRLRSQSRVLPHAAINEELELRVAKFRDRMREAPSPREKRRLKTEARDELMPRALLRSDRIWGFVDLQEKILGIDTARDAAAKRFLRRLQASIDGLSIGPLQYTQAIGEFLHAIFTGAAPKQFAAGRECRMQDTADAGSIVRWTDFDLTDSAIRNHVTNGMRLTHLAIEYDNVMSCVLDQNGVISKLKFIDMDDDSADKNDPLARLDAAFVLLTGTLRSFLGDLKKALGGIA